MSLFWLVQGRHEALFLKIAGCKQFPGRTDPSMAKSLEGLVRLTENGKSSEGTTKLPRNQKLAVI